MYEGSNKHGSDYINKVLFFHSLLRFFASVNGSTLIPINIINKNNSTEKEYIVLIKKRRYGIISNEKVIPLNENEKFLEELLLIKAFFIMY
jgi:hypothetical protein